MLRSGVLNRPAHEPIAMGMLCQRCQKAQATVHLTEIVQPDGDKHERHLCERCAAEEGLTMQKQEPISAILEGLVKHSAGMSQADEVTCPQCGLSFRDFRSTGLLGCPNDYKAFASQLAPLIERAHDGATHHVGKSPGRLKGTEPSVHVKIARLQRSLKEALEVEDYERAAQLRDEIKALESA